MRLYTATVRIGGSRDHEVVKHNLTGPEMKLLEKLHAGPQGHPVLLGIEHTGDVNRSDAKERARLADTYTKGELVEDRGLKLINGLFGLPGVPLPQEYVPDVPVEPTDFNAGEDEVDEVITPVEKPKRSEPKKPVAKTVPASDLVG